MIISKTPFRMSFVGGGSDLETYWREQPGAVVSTAVDKFMYVLLNQKFDDRIRLSYSRTEEADSPEGLEHPIVRTVLRKLGLEKGLEIVSVADIPSKGTGLGSSSAFTVGLLHALHVFRGTYRSAADLAAEACEVEIELLGEPIGKQDQYASAFGGFNFIQFQTDGTVTVDPIVCRRETTEMLEENLLAFFTGTMRRTGPVLAAQKAELEGNRAKRDTMRSMVHLAHALREELQKNNLETFGSILHENWMLKRSLAGGVSTPEIDAWYSAGRAAGAIGGKILGAGAGGFLVLYAPRDRHDAIRRALPGLRPIPFRFEKEGSRIVFVH
jgi:D-glycero-alpha-D-manno-heptose-7-phosphate kinase